VAVVAALHDFPTALIVWAVLFLVYQQLQDRVIQPIFYKSAVRIQPAVAVLVVLAGAQLAGILGALLAIPTAAALGAIFDELWPRKTDDGQDATEPEPEGEGSGSGEGGSPAPAPASG
jgi:predicted PurR-regulated permease PerM